MTLSHPDRQDVRHRWEGCPTDEQSQQHGLSMSSDREDARRPW